MIYFSLVVIILFLDRLSKILASRYLFNSGGIDIIPKILELRYCENTGAAFSMLSSKTFLLSIITFIVIIGLILFMLRQMKMKKNSKWFILSIAMIIGGALGNLFDRIFYGFVVDYFNFTFVNFAVFNVADCFISIGAVIFCCFLLFDKKLVL